jgi:hypothetical protein
MTLSIIEFHISIIFITLDTAIESRLYNANLYRLPAHRHVPVRVFFRVLLIISSMLMKAMRAIGLAMYFTVVYRTATSPPVNLPVVFHHRTASLYFASRQKDLSERH